MSTECPRFSRPTAASTTKRSAPPVGYQVMKLLQNANISTNSQVWVNKRNSKSSAVWWHGQPVRENSDVRDECGKRGQHC